MTHTNHTITPDQAPTPPAPAHDGPPEGRLVWSTAMSGPSRKIIDEWERIVHRPRVIRRVNTWDFLPHPVEDLDQLLQLCGFGKPADDSAADHILWHVVRLASHDDLAAQVVLHRVLPSIMSIARRRGRIVRGGTSAAMSELIATAWIVIKQFPHDRRRAKIAANLVRDIEYYAFVRDARLKKVPEAQVGDSMLNHIIERPGDVVTDIELGEVLAEAAELGVEPEHIELLGKLGAGMHGDDIALEWGVSPRTVRNHRRRAIDAVREVLISGD